MVTDVLEAAIVTAISASGGGGAVVLSAYTIENLPN